MASITRAPDFVSIDGRTTFVLIDCLCEAATPDDCDCPDAIWFERVPTRANPQECGHSRGELRADQECEIDRANPQRDD